MVTVRIAGVVITKLLHKFGIKNIVIVDSKGIVEARKDLNHKYSLIENQAEQI